jgi:hypothetical protein
VSVWEEVMWWKILHNHIALWSWDWWKQTLICFTKGIHKTSEKLSVSIRSKTPSEWGIFEKQIPPTRKHHLSDWKTPGNNWHWLIK